MREYTKAEVNGLMQRDTPKPPDRIKGFDTSGFNFKCPMCRCLIGAKGRGALLDYEKFCPRCGQRLDWNRAGIRPGWGDYTKIKEIGSVGYVEREE